MRTVRSGPRGWADELTFIPRTLAERDQLIEALLAAGAPRQTCHGIADWLDWLRQAGAPGILVPRSSDWRSDAGRRNYRRWLAQLGEPPWSDGYDGAGVQEAPFRGSSIGRARGC